MDYEVQGKDVLYDRSIEKFMRTIFSKKRAAFYSLEAFNQITVMPFI